MEYYERIKNLREDRDITQKDIAKLIGTSQSYYAQYENGKRPIPFERIIQIANILNIFYRLHSRKDEQEGDKQVIWLNSLNSNLLF